MAGPRVDRRVYWICSGEDYWRRYVNIEGEIGVNNVLEKVDVGVDVHTVVILVIINLMKLLNHWFGHDEQGACGTKYIMCNIILCGILSSPYSCSSQHI